MNRISRRAGTQRMEMITPAKIAYLAFRAPLNVPVQTF